jgi:hypothetical protein
MLETLFGARVVNADGRTAPVRLVGEQHVREDPGLIPSFADWPRLNAPQPWMPKGDPLDEPAITVAVDSGPDSAIPVRPRPAINQPSASPSEPVPPAGGTG